MAHQCKIFFILTFFISLHASETHLGKITFAKKKEIDLCCSEKLDYEKLEENEKTKRVARKSNLISQIVCDKYDSSQQESTDFNIDEIIKVMEENKQLIESLCKIVDRVEKLHDNLKCKYYKTNSDTYFRNALLNSLELEIKRQNPS